MRNTQPLGFPSFYVLRDAETAYILATANAESARHVCISHYATVAASEFPPGFPSSSVLRDAPASAVQKIKKLSETPGTVPIVAKLCLID